MILGEEVVSGSQRIHCRDLLLQRISMCGIANDTLAYFTDSFQYVSRSTNILRSYVCKPDHLIKIANFLLEK